MNDFHNIDQDDYDLEDQYDWIESNQDYLDEHGDFNLTDLSLADYAKQQGMSNQGVEDDWETNRERWRRKTKSIGTFNMERMERHQTSLSNAIRKEQRIMLTKARRTRRLVGPEKFDTLGLREYIQNDGEIIFRTKRGGVIRRRVEGRTVDGHDFKLPSLRPGKRVFKRPHPLPMDYTLTGMLSKNNTASSRVKMTVDEYDATKAPLGSDTFWLHYDSLPRPTSVRYDSSRNEVEYTWAVSQKERNRLMHALTGNGVGGAAGRGRGRGRGAPSQPVAGRGRGASKYSRPPTTTVGGAWKVAAQAATAQAAADHLDEDRLLGNLDGLREAAQDARDVFAYASRYHDLSLLGKHVAHSHPCSICKTVFEHTHEIRTKAISDTYPERCKACAANAIPGVNYDEIVPLTGPDRNATFGEATATPKPTQVCKHWMDKGTCKYDPCKFAHPPKNSDIREHLAPESKVEVKTLAPKEQKEATAHAEDHDKYRAQARLFFMAVQLAPSRRDGWPARVNRWMIMCDIAQTTAAVDLCWQIVQEEYVKAQIIDDNAVYEAEWKASIRGQRRAAAIEEAAGRAESRFSPNRWLQAIKHSIRKTFEEDLSVGQQAVLKQATWEEFEYMDSFSCVGAAQKLITQNVSWNDMFTDMFDEVNLSRLAHGEKDKDGYSLRVPGANAWVRKTTQYPVAFTILHPEDIWIPSTDSVNMAVAIVARQMRRPHPLSTPETTVAVCALGDIFMRVFWHFEYDSTLLTDVEREEQYLDGKPARAKALFAAGKAALEQGRPCNPVGEVFIKVEVEVGKVTKKVKRHPRAITANSKDGTMTAFVNPTFIDYQHQSSAALFSLENGVESCAESLYIYTGGKSGEQVGEMFGLMVARGLDILESDLSRCDSRCCKVKQTFKIARYRENGLPDRIAKEMDMDQTVVRSADGFKAKCGNSRGSGAADTSKGTTDEVGAGQFSFVMTMAWCFEHVGKKEFVLKVKLADVGTEEEQVTHGEMVKGWIVAAYNYYRVMEKTEIRKHAYNTGMLGIGLGDDGVLGFLPKYAMRFGSDAIRALNHVVFRHYGHVSETVFHHAGQTERVSFCSKWFWEVRPSVFVLDSKCATPLTKLVCCDPALGPKDMPGYLKGVAGSYKHSYWVPIVGPIMQLLSEQDVQIKRAHEGLNPHKIHTKAPVEVDPECIASHFYAIYGRPISDFDYLNKVEFTKTGRSWNLPGLRQLAIIDGKDASFDNG